jgi:hypothetical protein
MIYREPLPGSSPTTHDLVTDQQNAMFLCNFAKSRQIFVWWDKYAIRSDYRFYNDGRNV